jgi:O-antigen/teichoic acid export membrane protein
MSQGRSDDEQVQTGNVAKAGTAISRNTFWNLLGASSPILIALITIPILIGSIGTQRFGVLAIAWVVLGYFGLFDLGLGRATIKFVAEAFERNRPVEVRGLFWTVTGGVVLALAAPVLVREILNIPSDLHSEALGAFYLMACSVPLVTTTTAARGVLEARHQFGLLNALQVPTSAITQVAPVLVLPFSNNLAWLVGALVASRVLGMIVFTFATLRSLESPFAGPFFLRKRLKSLFSYGGWLTVTNVIGPFMVYADRFVIGSLTSMTAVAYYATPYEAVTRLWILPHSLTRTMFPIFSASTDIRQRSRIYMSALKYLTLLLAPVVATLVVFAPDVLRLWIGNEFAENSTMVLQLLAIGVFVNSLALVPFTLIQGLGRPDITAKFHLLELPFYLLMLWYGISQWGIAGAAIAWTVRVTVDGILLVLYVRMTDRLEYVDTDSSLLHTMTLGFLLICGGWLLFVLSGSFLVKASIWGLVLVVVAFLGWKRLLGKDAGRIARWSSITKNREES